jgi:hypothetical protein
VGNNILEGKKVRTVLRDEVQSAVLDGMWFWQ